MAQIYNRLSENLHFNIGPLNGIELNTGWFSNADLEVLKCVCVHFHLDFTVVVAEKGNHIHGRAKS